LPRLQEVLERLADLAATLPTLEDTDVELDRLLDHIDQAQRFGDQAAELGAAGAVDAFYPGDSPGGRSTTAAVPSDRGLTAEQLIGRTLVDDAGHRLTVTRVRRTEDLWALIGTITCPGCGSNHPAVEHDAEQAWASDDDLRHRNIFGWRILPTTSTQPGPPAAGPTPTAESAPSEQPGAGGGDLRTQVPRLRVHGTLADWWMTDTPVLNAEVDLPGAGGRWGVITQITPAVVYAIEKTDGAHGPLQSIRRAAAGDTAAETPAGTPITPQELAQRLGSEVT
jgi:hypothetical protein